VYVLCGFAPLPQGTDMSYDLYFWQQDDSCQLAPEYVIDRFSNGEYVQGIEPLPVDAGQMRGSAVFKQ
jgi:hypothetical protein